MRRTLRRPILLALALVGIAIGGATEANAGGYHVEYAFTGGGDGSRPSSTLLEMGGKLYGTAGGSGDNRMGEVYSLDPTTGIKAAVYSFKGGADGAFPNGGLISVGGLFYGTTTYGGGPFDGTVFSLDPASGTETVVYTFQGGADGANPATNLIMVGGLLYGVTLGGGVAKQCTGCGTVFSLDPATGVETVLHTFRGGADGSFPYSKLILVNGALFGTTVYGGIVSDDCSQGCGTVFSVNPATGKTTVVYAFKGGSDGDGPFAGLIEVSGALYGTTQFGGGGQYGSIFSFDPKTSVETPLYSFQGGDDGSAPFSDLIKVGGVLYGTTVRGGHLKGTVFSFDPATGEESVLRPFKGVGDGKFPRTGLTELGHRLYGTTSEGGSTNCKGGCGTVFSIRP